MVQYSTLIPPTVRKRLNGSPIEQVRPTIEQSPQPFLSEFPEFLHGKKTLDIPVYAVWGACEDVAVLERFRTGQYQIPNLYILDEATTYLLDIGGVSLRLFGLGGAVVQHKLFDNGEGKVTYIYRVRERVKEQRVKRRLIHIYIYKEEEGRIFINQMLYSFRIGYNCWRIWNHVDNSTADW